ncbi:50S ribosome-binding GTPase [Acholeplasma equirhinis]|uniref:GTPase n=1 Tax=Acholeplasma equirhinis TaxID=555393 RepID=UPI00197ABF57|nr:GTPase [Acholeplasma equirhinis]MBN3490587.1 50S ribosome-binding GTPase [Acholeplasma equirhinis]
MQNDRTCLGCGASLQTENPNELGYVKTLEQPFCSHCFKLMHYGKGDTHFHPDRLPEFKKNALIVIVSSVLYLDTLLTSEVKRLADEYHVVHLINQIDLLPASTDKNFLLGKIQKQFNQFRVSYDEIILMSALNKLDINNLKNYLRVTNYKEVYFIGLQNSGKTTIFKALTGNKEALAIKKAALTQRILSGKFDDMMIYDTPGLYQSGYLHEFFPYETYKDLLPSKQFKPKNGMLEKNDAILIDGLVGLSILKGETKSVFYGSDAIKLHPTKADKVESILNNELVTNVRFDQYVMKEYALKEDRKYQITFADFGFMILTGPVTIRLFTHPKLHISVLEGFIK